jgi:hypothetical protein
MTDTVTEYTNISIQSSNRHLMMYQLQELATSLIANIQPSQFGVLISLLQASDKYTEQVVSPEEPNKPALLTETPLFNKSQVSSSTIPKTRGVCSGIASKMLNSILDTNPEMIVKQFNCSWSHLT